MNGFPSSFLIVASPSQEVMEDTVEFKRQAEKYLGHSFRSRNSIPHLTIHTCQDFHNESKLYRYQEIISQIAPFKIYIDGFGAFRNNGTIYLRPVLDHHLRLLSEQLSGTSITPHITIVRRLSHSDFNRVWEIFQSMRYKQNFLCAKITVLKRSGTRWLKHVELELGASLITNDVSQLSHRLQF